MKKRPGTITLTVLGCSQKSSSTGSARQRRGAAHARRARLVVRPGEVHGRLRLRLIDTIIRLAGSPVVEVSLVVDRILADLSRHHPSWPARSSWTLAEVPGDPFADPYDRRTTTLALIDTPVGTALPHRLLTPAIHHVPVQADRRVCLS